MIKGMVTLDRTKGERTSGQWSRLQYEETSKRRV